MSNQVITSKSLTLFLPLTTSQELSLAGISAPKREKNNPRDNVNDKITPRIIKIGFRIRLINSKFIHHLLFPASIL
jgi:hypothetical protein